MKMNDQCTFEDIAEAHEQSTSSEVLLPAPLDHSPFLTTDISPCPSRLEINIAEFCGSKFALCNTIVVKRQNPAQMATRSPMLPAMTLLCGKNVKHERKKRQGI